MSYDAGVIRPAHEARAASREGPLGLWRQVRALSSVAADIHRMAGQDRRLLYVALVLAFSTAFVEAAFMLFAVPLLTRVLGQQSGLPGLFDRAGSLVPSTDAGAALLPSVVLLAIGLLLKQGFVAATESVNYAAAARIVTHIRTVATGNLLEARLAFLDRLKSGAPRHVVVTETTKVLAAARALVDMLGGTLSAALTVALLFTLSPELSVLLSCLVVALVPAKVRYSLAVHRAHSRAVSSKLDMTNQLNEALLGIRQIKVSNRQAEFLERVRRESERSEAQSRRARILTVWEPVLVQSFTVAGLLGILGLNHALALVTAQQMIAYFFLLYRAVPIANQINTALGRLLEARPSLREAQRLYTLPDEAIEERSRGKALAGPIERIALENVSLDYGNGQEALAGISLALRTGEIVAVVGESGSGKTSVSALLLGLYRPTSGRVLFGDRDLAGLSLDSVRARVGFVGQDVHLFNSSIREVIRGGDTSLTQHDVEAAAREAEADAFVRELEQGYDTVVGERGVLLSGGQRQRLLLAQVYARRTPVIVLDEATSALDRATAQRVMSNLARHRERRIILVITHRLESLESVDRVCVLERGRVVGDGPWSELRKKEWRFLSEAEA